LVVLFVEIVVILSLHRTGSKEKLKRIEDHSCFLLRN